MDMDELWGLQDDEACFLASNEDSLVTDDEAGEVLDLQKNSLEVKKLGLAASRLPEIRNSRFTSSKEIIEKRQKDYRCDRCVFLTEDFMEFIGHKNLHDANEEQPASFICGMCKFTTPSPEGMTEHIQRHIELKCSASSVTKSNLMRRTYGSEPSDIWDLNNNAECEVPDETTKTSQARKTASQILEIQIIQPVAPVSRANVSSLTAYDTNACMFETTDSLRDPADAIQLVNEIMPVVEIVQIHCEYAECVVVSPEFVSHKLPMRTYGKERSSPSSFVNVSETKEGQINRLQTKSPGRKNQELKSIPMSEVMNLAGQSRHSEELNKNFIAFTDYLQLARINADGTLQLPPKPKDHSMYVNPSSIRRPAPQKAKNESVGEKCFTSRKSRLNHAVLKYKHRSFVRVKFHGSDNGVIVSDNNVRIIQAGEMSNEATIAPAIEGGVKPGKQYLQRYPTKEHLRRNISPKTRRAKKMAATDELPNSTKSLSNTNEVPTKMSQTPPLDFSVFEFYDSFYKESSHRANKVAGGVQKVVGQTDKDTVSQAKQITSDGSIRCEAVQKEAGIRKRVRRNAKGDITRTHNVDRIKPPQVKHQDNRRKESNMVSDVNGKVNSGGVKASIKPTAGDTASSDMMPVISFTKEFVGDKYNIGAASRDACLSGFTEESIQSTDMKEQVNQQANSLKTGVDVETLSEVHVTPLSSIHVEDLTIEKKEKQTAVSEGQVSEISTVFDNNHLMKNTLSDKKSEKTTTGSELEILPNPIDATMRMTPGKQSTARPFAWELHSCQSNQRHSHGSNKLAQIPKSKYNKCKHCEMRLYQYLKHQRNGANISKVCFDGANCNTTDFNQKYLKNHKRTQQTLVNSNCDQCDYATRHMDSLTKRRKYHNENDLVGPQHYQDCSRDGMILRCGICWYSTGSVAILSNHLQTHIQRREENAS